MSTANFLADGYTQPGYLQAVPRLHDALRFRFRPVLVPIRSPGSRQTPRRHPTAQRALAQRAGKRLHVELKLVGKSEQLSAELKAVAQQTSEKAIKYHQFVRDRQIYASIRKH